MEFIPDWAPNLHPLLIHFPIVLLIGAVVLDLIAVIAHRSRTLQITAIATYVLGAVAVYVAFETGQDAAEVVMVPEMAEPVFEEHMDWATYLVWFYGIYAGLRLVLLWLTWTGRVGLRVLLLAVGAGGLFLLVQTAEHGAELVYRFGVGVQAMPVEADVPEPMAVEALPAGPVVQPNGAWRWVPATDSAWTAAVTWLAGEAASVQGRLVPEAASADTLADTAAADTTAAQTRSAPGMVLAIEVQEAPVHFVMGDLLPAMEADVTLDVSAFDGIAMITHHARSDSAYLFAAVGDGTLRQGRVAGGDTDILAAAAFTADDWTTLRVVAGSTGIQAYANGALVTQGSIDEALLPGRVGLRFDGTGTVRLRRMAVEPIREEPVAPANAPPDSAAAL